MTSTDPFQSLHRMSTTAGVSSSEYVAVNYVAIASLIVAILSGFLCVFFDFDYLFLLFPLVGLILAVIAILQIRRSNGTQTGIIFAIAGLILSALVSSTSLAVQVHQSIHDRSDKAAIAGLASTYGQCLADKDYQKAYSLFSPTFQEQIPFPEFIALIKQFEQQTPIGSVTWTGLAEFSDLEDGSRAAEIALICHIPGLGDWRTPATVRQINGVWKFENVHEQFPTRKHWQQQ